MTTDKKVYKLNTRKSDGDKITIPADKFWDKEMLSILFGATAQTQQPFLNRVIKYYFEKKEFEKILMGILVEHL